eukprot:Lithocolla_globosa_v1_NODE_10737_length_571_cov_15.556202.p1 type:complete len:161 gc:universal NODE_10737_length_571_cov_15.556202:508-26(-)
MVGGFVPKTAIEQAKKNEEKRAQDWKNIQASYEEVRKDDGEINWVLCSVTNPNDNFFEVIAKGKGGMTEMSSHLDDEFIMFAYVRFEYEITSGSKKQSKFAIIQFVGGKVAVFDKGKSGKYRQEVVKVWREKNIEIQADDKDDVSEKEVINHLKRNGQYE